MKSEFAGARVLITGGLGFIGSNLARRLAGLGADLTLVDSLIPEYGGNLFNIEGLRDRVHVNISDVRDTYSMQYSSATKTSFSIWPGRPVTSIPCLIRFLTLKSIVGRSSQSSRRAAPAIQGSR